jgi:hypothetical protein
MSRPHTELRHLLVVATPQKLRETSRILAKHAKGVRRDADRAHADALAAVSVRGGHGTSGSRVSAPAVNGSPRLFNCLIF